MLVLVETNVDQAVEVAERVREAVAERHVPVREPADPPDGQHRRGGHVRRPADHRPTLLRQADEKLYLAKRTGRNKVAL